jgi:hypothetical protein
MSKVINLDDFRKEKNISLYDEDEYISEIVHLLTNTECDDFEELWEE